VFKKVSNDWDKILTTFREVDFEHYDTRNGSLGPETETIVYTDEYADYVTWFQEIKPFQPGKHFYVKDTAFADKDAFYQGGAGVSKFTESDKVASKNTNPIDNRPGKLVINYRLLNGTTATKYFNVTVQVRECEAFSKGLYTEIQRDGENTGVYQDK
jgi:hypothetical protein